jgi:hypothetical protein
LEVLDFSRNRLKNVPYSIAKLPSLKSLALQKNEIQVLPLCLADMPILQVVKIKGNPIEKSIPGILEQPGHQSRRDDLAATVVIKDYLRNMAQPLSPSPMSLTEGAPLTRHSSRRYRGGRFPVRVDTSEVASRRPPISGLANRSPRLQHDTSPQRSVTYSHSAQQSRKNSFDSENALPRQRHRNYSLPHRDGLQPDSGQVAQDWKQPSLLDVTNQHTRGLSLGSTMTKTTARPMVNPDRLSMAELRSVLPPKSTPSTYHDPLLSTCKTVFFSLHQLHWLIKILIPLLNDGGSREPSIQALVYDADSYLRTLGRLVASHTQTSQGMPLSVGTRRSLQFACTNLNKAYIAICSIIYRNADALVDTAEFHYIRQFMALFWSAITGLRCIDRGATTEPESLLETLTPKRRDELWQRQNMMHSSSDSSQSQCSSRSPRSCPALRPAAPITNCWGPAAAPTAVSGPVSGLGLQTALPIMSNFHEAIDKCCNLVLATLPELYKECATELKEAERQEAARSVTQAWHAMVRSCKNMLRQAGYLRDSVQAFKSAGAEAGNKFRELCYRMATAWAELGTLLQQSAGSFRISPEMKNNLRQIQVHVKGLTSYIMANPSQGVCL